MEKNKKVKKKYKYRKVKCECCKSNIDIQTAIENEDYEKFSDNKILIFCGVCGNEQIVKL